MCGLGWKSLGVLELTALPSIDEERWVPMVEETDALLVDGGDALYLSYWMRQSGLADLLPSLRAVWVGLSAGSMVMTPSDRGGLRRLEAAHRWRQSAGTG
jgi:dipeptidase E